MVVQDVQNRDIANDCHQRIRDLISQSDEIVCVAFPPGGGARWSVLSKNNKPVNKNVPPGVDQAMIDLEKEAKVTCVAYTPQGGWVVINAAGSFIPNNIPSGCLAALSDNKAKGAKTTLVAFTPQDNGWVVINDRREHPNGGVPPGCITDLETLMKNDGKIVCVAFPPQGGESWTVINHRGGYFNRNAPPEAHMYMGYFSQINGPIQWVAYDADGSGWSVLAKYLNSNVNVGDGFSTKRVYVKDVYQSIQAQLNDNVVGYACTVGTATSSGSYSWGLARTNANAPAQLFLPSTKIHVASVSKMVTALAVLRVLGTKHIDTTATIGQFLPNFWNVDIKVKNLSFRDLLSHRSGIKDYGNIANTYDNIRSFFESLNDKADVKIWLPDGMPTYSNWNFAIMRVILPIVDGFSNFAGDYQVPMADQYVKLVQQNVFEPVGRFNVLPKPPNNNTYAYAYKYPGTASGNDNGDFTLRVGAMGWWLSIDDIAPVLDSLNKNDGRVLTSDQVDEMRSLPIYPTPSTTPSGKPRGWPLGFDTATNNGTTRWSEKNGGWSSDGTSITTTVALFADGMYGAIFANSNILGTGFQNLWQWCNKCQAMASVRSSNLGSCSAGGLHDHTGSSGYDLPTGPNVPSGGQGSWRWCWKCETLVFAGTVPTHRGKCPGGNWLIGHEHAYGSDEEYFLQQWNGSGTFPPRQQNNWKWCKKCEILAYGSTPPGPCIEGGTHDHSGSGDYIVKFDDGADWKFYTAYQAATMDPSKHH